MISLRIDGRDVQVPEGTTVFSAAETLGIEIPALCRDPELSSPGACRLCVVKIEGMRNLPASCVTEVTEGMEVLTEDVEVTEARQNILDLLLASHPEDCLACDKSGECLLQDYAYRYGLRETTFQRIPIEEAPDERNPVVYREPAKCIKCGKCVRVCAEVQERHVIDFSSRGFETRVGPPLDLPLEESGCIHCGSCISVCPVGALMEKPMLGKGRRWQMQRVPTVCPYCGTGCSLDLHVVQGKVVGASASGKSPVNGRHLCVKGRFGTDFIHDTARLTSPLVRKDGQLVETSWEEAISRAAEGLGSRARGGAADAVAVLASARMTTEENYLLNRFTREVLGTNNLDHCARL